MRDKDKTVKKIYSDIQFMEEGRKDKFRSLGQNMLGALFIVEFEQEITRIGFSY